EDAALKFELGVQRRVERDCQPELGCDGPARASAALDEHFVRTELVARRAKAPVAELLELARLQRGAHSAERLAELRPENRQVRLDDQLGCLDLTELDLLHAQLIGELVRLRANAVGTVHDEAPQRLAQLQPR